MPPRAQVTSVEAIEDFRAKLIVYLSKARPTLEEVSGDVARARAWLESEQRVHWEGQVRRRLKKLEEAQQALFSAEVSNLREATVAERMSVNKAKRALQEAEEKLKRIKKWSREFDSRVAPLAKQLGKLQTILTKDVPQAIAYLTQTVNTLHAYAEIGMTAETRSASESKENFTFETSGGSESGSNRREEALALNSELKTQNSKLDQSLLTSAATVKEGDSQPENP